MDKSQFYLLGLATLIGFPLFGGGIIWIVDDPNFAFSLVAPIWQQVLVGTLAGLTAGLAAMGITKLPFMKPVKQKYEALIGEIDLSWPEILFISLCAGIGEEYLFRGVIQFHWGIWPTSILFVAIHGYLNPKDWRVSIYGAFMVAVIGGIGYINNYIGLPAAMIAHTLIDVILLVQLKQNTHENYSA